MCIRDSPVTEPEKTFEEALDEHPVSIQVNGQWQTFPNEMCIRDRTYYVAECMEFPNLGEYHDNLSLEEAIRIYQEIPAERMNGILSLIHI